MPHWCLSIDMLWINSSITAEHYSCVSGWRPAGELPTAQRLAYLKELVRRVHQETLELDMTQRGMDPKVCAWVRNSLVDASTCFALLRHRSMVSVAAASVAAAVTPASMDLLTSLVPVNPASCS
jgi:hypothetical protein